MRPALRFVLASLASTLSSMTLLTLTMSLFLWPPSVKMFDEGTGAALGGIGFMLVLVILIGGMIALPASILAGGAMLLWQKRRGATLSTGAWIFAGMVAGVLVSAFTGTIVPFPDRLATAPLFASAGALGAWTFVCVWRCGQTD